MKDNEKQYQERNYQLEEGTAKNLSGSIADSEDTDEAKHSLNMENINCLIKTKKGEYNER